MNRIEKVMVDDYPAIFATYGPELQSDIERIQSVALTKGYHISLKQADELWEKYSEHLGDSWWEELPLTDNELAQILLEEV